MKNRSECNPATVNVAMELVKDRGLRVVEAWIALKEDRRLASLANDEAPYEIYMKVTRNLGTDIADARSHIQEDLHGLPSSYHHYVELAAVHGVLNWPLMALSAYARQEPAKLSNMAPSQLWANALAKHVMRHAKQREQIRALLAKLELAL